MIGSPFWNRMPVTGSQSHGLPHRPFPSFLEAVGEYLGPISSSFFSLVVGPKFLFLTFTISFTGRLLEKIIMWRPKGEESKEACEPTFVHPPVR